jgi:hypothetical protein
MAIVDRLEFVEVEIHQGCCRLVAFDVSQGTGKRALEAAPIEGLGERIDIDPVFQFADALAGCRKLRRKPLDLHR